MNATLRILLMPFALLYAMMVFVRNRLFDFNLLPSRKGALPAIIIGNLAAGGTGKTPHAECIIQYFKTKTRVALLSRGYGRKTRGYLLHNDQLDAMQFGDEPKQIATKFPDVPVAVCEDRLTGIVNLKRDTSAELVILDDAMQHRRLQGDCNILLTAYHNPYWTDLPLPAGYLRDNRMEKRRAHCIVVTKCPAQLSEQEQEDLMGKAGLNANQSIHFTAIAYGEPVHLCGAASDFITDMPTLAFAGIADVDNFKLKAAEYCKMIYFKRFADHHIFSHSDILSMAAHGDTFGHPQLQWLTTEKDAMRLRTMEIPQNVAVFYLPIKVKFLTDEKSFFQQIEKQLSAA
ncbi:MAG: tetraacyldisaccharide 4'-kinase [Flavobacteriales bacterium]